VIPQRGKATRKTYRGGLREATVTLLPAREALGLLPAPDGGRTRWTSLLLALCAILMSWDGGPTLGDRFESARRCLLRWYPGRRRPGGSYQGFVAALRRRGPRLVRLLAEHYRTHVRRLAEGHGRWRVDGWLAFGVDSTKVDAPMTAANERCLGCASRAGSWPQMVLTCVFHVGSGLPWSFLRGHARSSERRHLCGRLLATLPAGALLLADAGFTGYGFWRRVTGSGRSFLVRVGSNVRLIEGLADVVRVRTYVDGIVWVWPADRQKRRCPPLVLRLITLTDQRNRAMYLLTDVLGPDGRQLDDATAARLYAMRWGVEVTFRALKQTLGRRKLLSDAPRNARAELSWAMIGLWTLLLIKAERCPRLTGGGGGRGVAAVLRVLRRAMANGRRTDVRRALGGVRPDAYRRSRPTRARHWPHKNRPRPPGKPKARNVTDAELALATELEVLGTAA
jgi:hypothetical protein